MLNIEIPLGYRSERLYAIEIIFKEFLGLEFTVRQGDNKTFTVISHESGAEIQVPDVFFLCNDKEWLSPASLPKLPLLRWDAREHGMETYVLERWVPLLYPSPDFSGELVACTGKTLEFRLDIFGATFFMLTRYEEVAQRELKDEHGRFPASASIACAEVFLNRPIIDEYVELFWGVLSEAFPGLRRKAWHYSVNPTHDLDRPFLFPSMKNYFRGLASLVCQGAGGPALGWLRQGIERIKGSEYDPFIQGQEYLLSLSEKYELKSCLNIMGASSGSKDFGYSLSNPAIFALVSKALARGHEIGFHPGYQTFGDPALFAEERSRIESALGITLKRGRQHYLRARFPETWKIWDDAGFSFDGSVGYAEKNGFRCGTCKSFPVFDIHRRMQLKLRASPLILMDGTLKAPFNEDLTVEEGVERGLALAKACRRYNGEFVILWHNSSLYGEWKKWTKVYEQILSEAVSAVE